MKHQLLKALLLVLTWNKTIDIGSSNKPSFQSSMQEFRFQPNQIDFLSTDCITTIILESFFNLFYLSTLAIGPAAMHFRPILLLHCPRPLPPVHRGVTTHQCTPAPAPVSEQR